MPQRDKAVAQMACSGAGTTDVGPKADMPSTSCSPRPGVRERRYPAKRGFNSSGDLQFHLSRSAGRSYESLPAKTEVAVKGVHFVQEDSPDEIGSAIAAWMKTSG